MKVVEVKMKIACCYEVAETIEDVMVSDDFAKGLRQLIAKEVNSGHEELDVSDMTVEIGEDDVKILYDNSKPSNGSLKCQQKK